MNLIVSQNMKTIINVENIDSLEIVENKIVAYINGPVADTEFTIAEGNKENVQEIFNNLAILLAACMNHTGYVIEMIKLCASPEKYRHNVLDLIIK